jgi:hypothetical protein
MIIPHNGEIDFADGLRITAHSRIEPLLLVRPAAVTSRTLPIEGWSQHCLGEHASGFGEFAVEVAVGAEQRVEAVFLSHAHSFYEATTPDDAERRVFHEGVIAFDLRGQREFSWGHVFCRVDRKQNRDWLVVIYSPFCSVPLQEREVYHMLFAHESPPEP